MKIKMTPLLVALAGNLVAGMYPGPPLDAGRGTVSSRVAAAQATLAVVGISPAPGAFNVPVTTTVTASFNFPLDASSVTPATFTLTAIVDIISAVPVAGTVSVLGTTATFRPLTSLSPQTTYQIRIVSGSSGVRGYAGQIMEKDFISTFRTGEATGTTTVRATTGGTVTDPRTGASATIPSRTLKIDVGVRIVTLDSPLQIGQVDNSCGVSIRPNEVMPSVEGFLRVSEVVRYEVNPCGAIAFGPGMSLRLPLLSPFRGTLPLGLSLRLFQLGRSAEGQLVFRDTGIPAKVIGGFLTGSAAVVPGIPVFGTFAAFLPVAHAPTRPAHASRSASAHLRREKSFLIRASSRNRSNVVARETPAAASEKVVSTTTELSADNAQAEVNALLFPMILEGGWRRTRISLVNPGSAPADVHIVAYAPSGMELGSVTMRIDPGRQSNVRVGDVFPGFTRGVIVARSNESLTGMYEIVNDYDKPTVLAIAQALRSTLSAMAFPVITTLGDDVTDVHLFNPSSEPLRVSVKAFDANGQAVPLTDSSGLPVSDDFELAPFATYVASSRDVSANTGPPVIPFAQLDGGYLLVQSLDPTRGLVGAEVFGTEGSGQPTVAVLNGLLLPTGCVLTNAGDAACHVDTSPESEVPEAVRQHTLYGLHFDDPPASSWLVLVNVSDRPAQVAVSAFREDGSFRGSFPPSGFLVPDLPPHGVLRVALPTALGFHPAPGYIRIEDQNSALVGVVINFDPVNKRYKTVLPLLPDDPRQSQSNVTTFLSRVRMDPSSSSPPRMTMGFVIFNPNNNSVPFTVRIRDNGGRLQTSSNTLVARGVFIRQRSAVSFPATDSGYVEMQTTGALLPGTGARLVLVGIYRASSSSGIQASAAVLEQIRGGN